MSELPKWPAPLAINASGSQWMRDEVWQVFQYEHARAEAALSRLREEHDTLTKVHNLISNARYEEFPGPLMMEALDLMQATLKRVGELPSEQSQQPAPQSAPKSAPSTSSGGE